MSESTCLHHGIMWRHYVSRQTCGFTTIFDIIILKMTKHLNTRRSLFRRNYERQIVHCFADIRKFFFYTEKFRGTVELVWVGKREKLTVFKMRPKSSISYLTSWIADVIFYCRTPFRPRHSSNITTLSLLILTGHLSNWQWMYVMIYFAEHSVEGVQF